MTGISASAKEKLRALSKGKTDLIRLLREEELRQARKIKSYPRADDVRLPTSWAQQRLWFIDQLEGGSSGYQIPLVVRLHGALDQESLQKALDTLVQRHEVLRTAFVSTGGDPEQEIATEGCFTLKVIDLSGYKDAECEAQVRFQKIEEAHERFDLRMGPLIRGRLLRVAAQEHVLLVTMHHIVSDGWSMGIFIRELAELYRAYREGCGNLLEPLPIQYADYAQWQRQWLQGRALERQLRYWRAHLEGAAPQLELPTDSPRPALQSYRGAKVDVVLDAQLCAKLRACAQRHEMTLFMILYAGWAILLSRLSGQDDVVVGTPVANRQRRELEGLIGFFVNTLALRIAVRGDSRVKEFLEQVKKVTLGAYDHQDVPFEQVVEALQPQRSLSRNPLFQVMFALQNAPKSELELLGLTVTLEDEVSESSIFDLFVSLEERSDQIAGSVYYATDLFDRETVERWVACFTVLLRGIVDEVQGRIGELPILPARERQQVIESFNATQAAYPHEKLIHELFEEQVQRTPDARAVVYERQCLTYAELNGRANQLARHLRAKGIGPDRLVGICVERGLEMIVGLLGILKAGGAYVPLDPAYPADRLRYMLEDSAPAILLTQTRLRGNLPDRAAQVVALDGDWREITQQPSKDLDARALGLRSHHLAYVIYTSGSTGQPKGVAIEHRNTTNLIFWARSAMDREVFDQTLQSTSLNFDLSVYECFVPLTVGGCIRVIGNALALAESPVEVTLINTVPSAISELLDSRSIPETTRVVNLAGEVLKQELVERIFAHSQVERVCNLYGPSETTTYSTSIWISRGSGFTASIGRPIVNTQIYILDRFHQVVPIGVIGEIHIGGAGVARGYLNRPELTAERFIAHPFSADPKSRLYKTGDLGRWRFDGTIEYLGRNDHQVKIRGYRIEPGEAEAVLVRHARVREAVVAAREDATGEKRLVAYVVAHRNIAPESTSDRAHEELRHEIVSEWETLHEETYEANTAVGPSFVGWKSSYTGQPIPEGQMQEWLACTVERIQALQPTKVLEIGCGVGLVLQHLAPQCAVYVGTDFSASALGQLRQWIRGREGLEHVELLHRSATELQDSQAGSFDAVVLNSVVQYFPDIEYLLTVLQEAVRLLAPGGKIFLGDVRHLGLLPMFHSAVQLSKAAATVSVGQLRKRIARAVAQEKELVIDPQFFQALPGHVPGISTVEVHLKRGRAPNELTRYRYDVVLHTDEQMGARTVCEPLEWRAAVGSAAELEAALLERRWRAVRLHSIPNLRLAREAAAQRLIETSDERLEASALRRQLNELQFDAIDPEKFWEWGQAHGYDARVSPGEQGCCEVQLLDRARSDQVPRAAWSPTDAVKPWSAYANDPLENGFRQQLIPELREYLKGRLPEYMVPSAWMVLKELPLTPNGKVDQRALPVPQSRPEELGEYVAPRTELEHTLADIWVQLLRIDQVGVQDNFFELGGHSLLATRVITHISDALDIDLPLRALFEKPTIEALSNFIVDEIAAELSTELS